MGKKEKKNKERAPIPPSSDYGSIPVRNPRSTDLASDRESRESDIFASIDREEHKRWTDYSPEPPANPETNRPFGLGPSSSTHPAASWKGDDDPGEKNQEHTTSRRNSANPFIEPLKEVSGPLVITDKRPERFKSSEVHFIACESPTSSGGLASAEFTRARTEEAIRLGEAYLARKPPSFATRRLTRAEARSEIFKEVIEDVNELLAMVVRYTDNENPDAYGVERSTLVRLKRKLAVWLQAGKADLAEYGPGTVPIPAWGLSGRGDEFWSANDFEILGACFRKEVEIFLTTIVDAMARGTEAREERRREEEAIAAGVEEMQNRLEGYFISKGIARKETRRTVEFDERSPSPVTRVKQEPASASAPVWGMRSSSLNPSPFSQPNRLSSSRKMNELFGGQKRAQPESSSYRVPVSPHNPFRLSAESQRTDRSREFERGAPPHMPPRTFGGSGNGPSDSDSSSEEDSSDDRRRKKSNFVPRKGRRDPRHREEDRGTNGNATSTRVSEVHFENKLKLDVIPAWDGKLDDLVRWIAKVNRLAERSQTAFIQLGALIPSKLSGNAETWYFSLPLSKRNECEENWGNLRATIAGYYMNRSFMEGQKIKANNVRYREGPTHARETPSEYFIRKLELLQLVYDYTDSELITEIMRGAPTSWVSIVTPHLYDEITEFQTVVRFHEETLMRLDAPIRPNPYRLDNNPFNRERNRSENFRNARVNLVGSSDALPPPQYPKDDANVSRRQTPESKGFRPCRHCGSGKHWDYECKYSRRSQRAARSNQALVLDEDCDAQREYDDGYYELQSEDEAQKDF